MYCGYELVILKVVGTGIQLNISSSETLLALEIPIACADGDKPKTADIHLPLRGIYSLSSAL